MPAPCLGLPGEPEHFLMLLMGSTGWLSPPSVQRPLLISFAYFPFAWWRFTSQLATTLHLISFVFYITEIPGNFFCMADPLVYFLRLIPSFSSFVIFYHFHVSLAGSSLCLLEKLTCPPLWMQAREYFEVKKVEMALGNGDSIIILSILRGWLSCGYLCWSRPLNNNNGNNNNKCLLK